MISKRFFYSLMEVLAFVVFMAILLSHSVLLLDPSKLYLRSIAHRLQTEAFFHGHIYLSPRPFGYLLDFNWIGGHGLQQNWGLGVPLLRFPFEWASVQLGLGPFPDRLILLFYLIFTVILLNVTLSSIMKYFKVGLSTEIRWAIRWYLIFWIFFSPSMGALIQYGADVYFETVLYGCLYVYVLVCLLWTYIKSRNNYNYYILCLASGLAWLIRPTLIFYGVPTVLIASIFLYQDKHRIRPIIIGMFCFCLGVFIEFWTNYLRFGSMWNLGYPETGNLLVNYSSRFGAPFNKENSLSAFKELLGALFLNNLWQSPTVRYRPDIGSFLSPFNIAHLMILLLGFISFFFSLLFQFSKKISSQRLKRNDLRIVYLSFAWGFISFSLLFNFYYRFSSVTLRYLSEFSIVINVVFIVLILLILFYTQDYSDNKKALILLFIFLGGLFYVTNERFFKFNDRSRREYYQQACTDKKGVKKLVAEFNHNTLLRPHLPEISYCNQSYSTEGLIYQYLGWNKHDDCLVHAVISAILPSQRCVTLNYTVQDIHQIPEIQVKRDLTSLKLVDSQMSIEGTKEASQVQMTQLFCSDDRVIDPIAQYNIKWATFDQFNKIYEGTLPVRLNWISVSEQCLNK